jgi:hypothetical protein
VALLLQAFLFVASIILDLFSLKRSIKEELYFQSPTLEVLLFSWKRQKWRNWIFVRRKNLRIDSQNWSVQTHYLLMESPLIDWLCFTSERGLIIGGYLVLMDACQHSVFCSWIVHKYLGRKCWFCGIINREPRCSLVRLQMIGSCFLVNYLGKLSLS